MKRALLFSILACLATNTLKAQNTSLVYNNSYTYINKSILSGTGSFTIEFILKTNTTSDNIFGPNPLCIVDISNSGNVSGRFQLICGYMNKLQFKIDDVNVFRSVSTIADMNFHHVAFVYDSASTKQYSIYIDGSLDTNLSGPVLNLYNQNSFRLGKDLAGNAPYDGELDEFRIFNYARSATAIAAYKDREFCNMTGTGFLAYYKFNDGAAGQDNRNLSQLIDFTGKGNHLSYNGFNLRGSCYNCTNFKIGKSLSGGNTRDTLTLFDCDTVVSPSGKFKWTSQGKYFDTLVNNSGCDSIILVNVRIGNSLGIIYKNVCDSFISPLGKIIKRDTVIYEVYRAYTGCDSTMFFDVKIRQRSVNAISVTSCDSFVSDAGNTYFNTGDYTEHFTNWKGCDSSVIYHVKINRSVNTFEYIEACDQGNIRGQWYNSSTVKSFAYKTYKGCDSTHYVFLTVNKSVSKNVKVSGCDSFVSPQGKIYRFSGNFAELLKTYKNCDSTVVYQVSIHNSVKRTANLTVCRGISINGIWHDQSGNVTYYGKTYSGCDSIVDIQLTVNTSDKTVTRNGNTLTVAQSGAVYQWISCSNRQAIPFESQQSFTPKFDGDYAVILLYNGCRDTSACISFRVSEINDVFKSIRGTIYPNPSEGSFELKLEQPVSSKVQITDMTGKILSEWPMEGDSLRMDVALPSGLYMLTLEGYPARFMLFIK